MALADVVQGLRLHASDISGAAVALARHNVAGLRAELYEGDLFDPLPVSLKGTVDTLLCNTPYVPSARVQTLPAEARVQSP